MVTPRNSATERIVLLSNKNNSNFQAPPIFFYIAERQGYNCPITLRIPSTGLTKLISCPSSSFIVLSNQVMLVMSEKSGVSIPLDNYNKQEPDCFELFEDEISKLLLPDDDFQPFTSYDPELSAEVMVREIDMSKNHKSLQNCRSLFRNGIGADFSDYKIGKLNKLLRQIVHVYAQQVEEMVNPVLAAYRLQCHLKKKKNTLSSGATFDNNEETVPHKKLKISSSSSSINESIHIGAAKIIDKEFLSSNKCKVCAQCHTSRTPRWRSGTKGEWLCHACCIYLKKHSKLPVKESSGVELSIGNELTVCAHCHTAKTSMWRQSGKGKQLCNSCGIGLKKYGKLSVKERNRRRFLIGNEHKVCTHCHTSRTPMWRHGAKGERLCNACGISLKKHGKLPVKESQGTEFLSGSQGGSENENELSEDMMILLESDSSLAEKLIKKQSDKMCTSLELIDGQLEGLLDLLMGKCRPMTHAEKQQLGKSIHELSPTNLDRVAEIIQRGKPSKSSTSGEIFVNLEKEDNRTLWRLYYYVQAVENP